MTSLKSASANKTLKNRRVPNAFMIFVKEHNRDLLQKCPDEDKAKLGAYIGRKWRSLPIEEKQVYYDKFKALKKLRKEESDLNRIEITTDTSSEDGVAEDKHKADESFSETFNNHTNQPANADDLSINALSKQRFAKKVRRPPNAFMIFAKEKRLALDPSIKNDKKIHMSTVVGNLWRELPDSQKAKYFDVARQLMNLHKLESASSQNIQKRKKKIQPKANPEKTLRKPRKKKKEFHCNARTNLRKQETGDIEKAEIESSSKKPLDKLEKEKSTNVPSEPRAFNDYPNSSYFHQYNNAMSHFHCMPPSVGLRHPNPCCSQSTAPDFNSCNNLKHNSTSDAGMPSFGAASFPSMFPSYPLNMSPWMYPQSMAPQWFPFPSPSFYPSPYNYNFPYAYNAYNNTGAYIDYYASQYARRVIGPSAYGTSQSSATSTVTSSNIKDESTEAEEKRENSDDEQLVVDEGDPKEEQHDENETV